jgi:hypothetical protein
MSTERLKVTKYENTPEWNSLTVTQKWSTWTMDESFDGDVELCCSSSEGDTSLFLNQDELKQVIEFLQSKVK